MSLEGTHFSLHFPKKLVVMETLSLSSFRQGWHSSVGEAVGEAVGILVGPLLGNELGLALGIVLG
jgi:hypothetical protein